jgi:hypothetical protein
MAPLRFAPLWFAALALLFGACSDDTRPPEKVVYVPEEPGRTIVFDDAGRPVPPVETPEDPTFILVIDGEDEETVNVASEVPLSVLLLDGRGDPVPGERVNWALEGDPDTLDAALAAQAAVTDENGSATLSLTSSSEPRELLVKAWHAASRVVEIRVHVVSLPVGGVRVDFGYNGPVRLGNAEVYLIDDADFCEQPSFLAPPDGVLHSANVQTIAEEAYLGPTLSGRTAAVLVRARLASNGTLAAGGCFGDLRIPEGDDTSITVPLFLLPLNPAGTYDTINHFNFTNAIPGTLGDVVRALVRFFGDQNNERQIASVIFDVVEGLIREAAGAIGGFVVDLIRGFVEDDLNDIINNYIDNDGPAWVRSFFQIGSDLISIVSNLEVISHIQITKPRADGTYDGSQSWIGLAFYWRLGCEGNPDPMCGRFAFTMDQVAMGLEGINLVFGQFTGRIHTYNKGEIDPHTLDLQYGRLILFVLNNLVLPAIADGARSLREALLNLANCPAFASGITGGDDELSIAGIDIVSRDTIEGWCTGVIGLAGDAAEAIVGNLRIDTRLTMSGSMTFVEETSDLAVDSLTEGVWTGTIRTQQDQGPPFNGDFAGPRLQ